MGSDREPAINDVKHKAKSVTNKKILARTSFMSAVNFLILDKEQDRSAKCFMALKQVCINEPFLTIVLMFLYDPPIFYEFPLLSLDLVL